MQSTITDFLGDEVKVKRPLKPGGFISHPMIREHTIESRAFQVNIAQRAMEKNTMVVLPTGLGKTIVALLVVAHMWDRGGKILFLAPTKPLVNQHVDTFRKFLLCEDMGVLTGSISPTKRAGIWESSRIIFSTPQVIRNDVKDGKCSLKEVALVIFDEAHRAVGKYAYVEIAENYVKNCQKPLILAMTASPGGNKKKIQDVMKNLYIECIEARTTRDPDVSMYVKDVEITWERTGLRKEMKEIQKLLESLLYEKISRLQRSGFVTYKKKLYVSKKDLIETRERIQQRLHKSRTPYLFGTMQNLALAMQAYHCLELLETQGVKPLEDYLRRLFEKVNLSRSEKSFINDRRCKKAYQLAKEYGFISHPKIELLKSVVKSQFRNKKDSLVIVFAQFRDTINSIMGELRGVNIRVARFVGQASRNEEKGLTQEEQKEVLDKFRAGEYNVLVASSVAEEGLDIPSVDLVVFYEPIPSEIRAIQRRGRTGRSDLGRVVILITEKTRDEAYLYAEISREKKMRRIVEWLSGV